MTLIFKTSDMQWQIDATLLENQGVRKACALISVLVDI